MNPTCSTNCQVDLKPVKFSDCNPVVENSEIRRIFIAKSIAKPFTNWANEAEWLTRMSESSVTGDDYIRVLTVIADKPAAAAVTKDISNGRKVNLGKDHTVNVTIDDTSDVNYEFMRSLECGGKFRIWYETMGGNMYGGNGGITKASVDFNDVLNRGVEEYDTFAGVITWRNKFHPERIKSPIFDADDDGGTAPSSYDTIQTFATTATKTSEGVTTTLAAVDPDAKFEFNKIASPGGTPASMSIVVSSAEQATVDFPADYLGSYFRYTDVAGVPHTDVFKNGTVNF